MNSIVRSAPLFVVAILVITTSVAGDLSESIDSYAEMVKLQVSEGLSLVAGAKAAVTEFYYDADRFPKSNEEAGLAPSYEIQGKYVLSVTVGPTPGAITVEYRGDADPAIAGRTIVHTPAPSKPKPSWSCASDYISGNYLPESCK